MAVHKVREQIELHFSPHPWVRHHHIQVMLASLRGNRAPHLRQNSQEMILEVGGGVKLQGFYAPQKTRLPKGTVLMLHGWLGCAEANYVMNIGEYLYRRGYAIFRLNFRDHGETYHLNHSVFRSDLIDEVIAVAEQVSRWDQSENFYIIGASLGGNFALRLALASIPNLKRTIAFCPVLNPYHSTLALDKQSLYLAYFRRRWRYAFRRKMEIFPDYDFSEELMMNSCLEMTEAIVQHHSPYPNALAYFDSYTITPAMLATLQTPATIIAAADDPVIPLVDFQGLDQVSPYLQLSIQPYGGHVGFVDIFPARSWMCEATYTLLSKPLYPTAKASGFYGLT